MTGADGETLGVPLCLPWFSVPIAGNEETPVTPLRRPTRHCSSPSSNSSSGTTLVMARRFRIKWKTVLSMIASKTTLNLKYVKSCFKALRVIAREEVRTTGKFIIPGLVTLTVKEKPAQRCRHPDWGIDTPTKKVIKVAPKKYLKDSVAVVPWHQTEEWLDGGMARLGGQMI